MQATLEKAPVDDPMGFGSVSSRGSGLLERVALALNSTLELWEVLRLLAGITREETGADRCSVFLLDGSVLYPTAAIGSFRDENLWEAFREMGPVDIQAVPTGLERLFEGRAVAVYDARESELIPEPWVERFSLKSVALVPLLVTGAPCGLMAVDYQELHRFSDDELHLLETIGSYAGVAVRNARTFEAMRSRSRLQEGLANAAAALVSPLDRPALADGLVGAYTDLFAAKLCAIGMVTSDHARVETLAARGNNRLAGSIDVSDIPERIIKSLQARWDTNGYHELEDDPWITEFTGGQVAGVSHYALLPLKAGKHLLGGILLGFDATTSLDDEQRSAANALTAIAAAAFERSILLDELGRQLHRMEILHDLGAALVEGANAAGLVDRLNHLLTGQGIEVTGLTFRDRSLARRLGGEEPTDEERDLWRARKPFARLSDGTLAIPMGIGRRLVGSVRVRPADLPSDERAFLEALAHGVAEVASRGALRAAVEEAERERAVAAERGRIAGDLHDTAGQLFVAIGLLARRQAGQIPEDSQWRERFARLAELADRGKWEITRAIQALAFFPAARRGIASALKSLARSIESDSGIQVLVDVTGAPLRLSPRIEQALYRVAHEALANAWRHARCSVIRAELIFSDDEVILRVTDDGVGVASIGGDDGHGLGIANMRRAVDEVAGRLRVRTVKPRGTLVEARVKKEER